MPNKNVRHDTIKNGKRLIKSITMEIDREIVGIVPAVGHAARLAPLPCSKELYPIGFRSAAGGRSVRPKAVCLYLLEKFQLAGVTRSFIVLREGKWDIPS